MDWLRGISDKAEVHPSASLGDEVVVGPFAVIGPKVRIGDRSRIASHVVVDGSVTMGSDNVVYPYTTIGFAPQDLKYAGEDTRVEIGDGNIFRENCQIHRGTAGGGGVTRIGNKCFFMVSSHIAHDCIIGDNVIFANSGTLGGHVEVGEHATVGAFTAVHQFCRIGTRAFIGGGSIITRDALPFCLTVGNRAYCYGVNKIGLKRSGLSTAKIRGIENAVRRVLLSEDTRTDALAAAREEFGDGEEVSMLLDFIENSDRGVTPLKRGSTV